MRARGTPTDLPAVAPLAGDGVGVAARVLARALTDDPGWMHVFPDQGTRTDRLTRTLDLVVARAYQPLSASWVIEGAAASVWAPPGRHDVPLATVVRAAPRLAWLVGRNAGRAIRLYRAMTRRAPREPHWYLAILGVDPDHQGRGLGVRVMAPGLARCDATRTMAWLESANPKNHNFYLRLGFEIADQVDIPGGPTLWFMARQPR